MGETFWINCMGSRVVTAHELDTFWPLFMWRPCDLFYVCCMHGMLWAVSWQVHCLRLLESLHPAVRSICRLLWPPVGSRAEDDVACYIACPCWHVCAGIERTGLFVCVLKCVNLYFLGARAFTHRLRPCVFILSLSVCLCDLVCVSSRVLYSPDSWHGWFGSQSVNVTIGQQLLLPTPTPHRPRPPPPCLSAHLSPPPRPRSQILWHLASNCAFNYWVILQWPQWLPHWVLCLTYLLISNLVVVLSCWCFVFLYTLVSLLNFPAQLGFVFYIKCFY